VVAVGFFALAVLGVRGCDLLVGAGEPEP
jgi:hypothetical protein